MFFEAILPKIFPILFAKILQQSSIKLKIILEVLYEKFKRS
jgi:hypothetical protein